MSTQWAFLVVQSVKNLPAMQETQVQSLGWEDPLEKGMATHLSILAWRIPWTGEWTEEPGGLQSMGSQGVRHDWVTDAHTDPPAPLGWLQPRIHPLLIRRKSHQTCMVFGHWGSEICTQTMQIAVLSWAWENTEVLLPFHKRCLGRGLLYSLDLTWVLLWTSRSLTGSQDKELQEPRLMSQLFSSSLSQFSLFPAQRCFLLAG